MAITTKSSISVKPRPLLEKTDRGTAHPFCEKGGEGLGRGTRFIPGVTGNETARPRPNAKLPVRVRQVKQIPEVHPRFCAGFYRMAGTAVRRHAASRHND